MPMKVSELNESHVLQASLGGELGKTITNLYGKTFICLGVCNRKKQITRLLGYRHDGGLADALGRKWWLYYSCQRCGYETSWWKIQNSIEKTTRELNEI